MKKSFGRRLWKLRKSRGLTQEQMVGELRKEGVIMSRGTYAKIEADVRGISIKELRAVRSILDGEWEDLLGKETKER